MLLAKYQSSRPPSLRDEVFWSWSSLVLVPTCDPQGRASFDPMGIIWINLVEVYKEMLHKKYLSSRPSSFRKEEFEKGLLCSYIPTCDHQGGAGVMTPGGII